ncbi:hypothetical protein D8B26_000360 [Coccidioides posadasii str. Silveira]|uniref:Maintenance of telomere capping protein 6 n=1 Tax=Coccidioides posadasii (strain RMSCC 757 / Silveira) TaxID=443226 RepID=E9D8I2_COCPS|nr:conserved hypothetical protein [Coccidioides posadasii str. Silveira]QVM05653.1 hypothetical protein D8B26_000360 [Coccidioides posadasii str. Silveira]
MRAFVPGNSSLLQPPWGTVQLSQRDVSIQIPINLVTQPAVSLSAACFGKKVYDEEAAKQCISNLLSVGYRRLYVDLYWSRERKKWSLCPVTTPLIPLGATVPRRLPFLGLKLLGFNRKTGSPTVGGHLNTRQSRNTTRPSDTNPAEDSTVDQTEVPTRKGPSGTVLFELGPYSCSANVDLTGLLNVVADYFKSTEDTLNAHLTYIIFDLHAASRPDTPHGSAPTPKGRDLPSLSDSLGTTANNALGMYIYTPLELDSERRDLNRSWYSVAPRMGPVPEYFNIIGKANSRYETPDGWPNEGYVELSKAQRLVMGWGKVDLQMNAYDFKNDNMIVFSPGSLTSFVTVAKDNNDNIVGKCLYNPNTTDISDVQTWATAEVPEANSTAQLSHFSNQMVSCGISPLVNHTLLNVTADQDIGPYRNVSLSSIWSWADGEPKDSINAGAIDENRCSVMDLSLSGHWRSSGCSDRLYAACRIRNSPFDWTLSREPEPYTLAGDTCPEGSSFDVPRTALENTYLYKHVLQQSKDLIDPSSEETEKTSIWLDFNSFDVPDCWVSGGPKAQCPYEVDESAIQRRNILVPSIAAIIILIITALTLFVKCNANRMNSRRRRVIAGWEYEGVPS